MRLVWATVQAVEGQTDGVEQLAVTLDDGTEGLAISYVRLSGRGAAGDRVLLNTTAVDLALGTGGKHFVVARLGEGSGISWDSPAGGHIMKLRYTPMQVDVLAVESQESPYHQVMKHAESLAGMPVVCCGLHSQVPLVAAAVKQANADLRVAYCMTDEAALSLELSDLVRASRSAGLLDATISCGQAFGGEFEAVNLHSGLLAARHVCGADVAIVAIGPGVVGTATAFGHGGISQGEAINAVSVLDGIPVACLRVSFADARSRHRGVSHHTLAALTRIALSQSRVPIPSLPSDLADALEESLVSAGVWDRHVRVESSAGRTAPPAMRGIEVRTMGRGFNEDPAFFAAAFAAGQVAAELAIPA